MQRLHVHLQHSRAFGAAVPACPTRELPDSGSAAWDAEQDRAFQAERSAWEAEVTRLADGYVMPHRDAFSGHTEVYRGHVMDIHLRPGLDGHRWCAIVQVFANDRLELLLTHSSRESSPFRALAGLRSFALARIDEWAADDDESGR